MPIPGAWATHSHVGDGAPGVGCPCSCWPEWCAAVGLASPIMHPHPAGAAITRTPNVPARTTARQARRQARSTGKRGRHAEKSDAEAAAAQETQPNRHPRSTMSCRAVARPAKVTQGMLQMLGRLFRSILAAVRKHAVLQSGRARAPETGDVVPGQNGTRHRKLEIEPLGPGPVQCVRGCAHPALHCKSQLSRGRIGMRDRHVSSVGFADCNQRAYRRIESDRP